MSLLTLQERLANLEARQGKELLVVRDFHLYEYEDVINRFPELGEIFGIDEYTVKRNFWYDNFGSPLPHSVLEAMQTDKLYRTAKAKGLSDEEAAYLARGYARKQSNKYLIYQNLSSYDSLYYVFMIV